ncbi:MAG: hypothetical protein QN120_11340 [Armatimonadota bacterium]|nr:hypothetical protein [Armatimonadota bacterium]
MRKAIEYLKAHPVIPIAIVVGLIGVIVLYPRGPSRVPVTEQPPLAPAPAASPALVAPAAPTPPAMPAPQVATPSPSPAPLPAAVGAVGTGRPDPFAPLVVAAAGGPAGVPLPPPAPLPPPLFPGQAPGQPSPAPTPTPPPKEASMAQLVGVLGDGGGVAIVRLEGKTYIVGVGDVILDKIKVAVVDVARFLVVLEQEGERFELKLGGVNGAHVAAKP